MRDTFVSTLLEIAKKDPNVFLITGDLGFGVLKPFWDELPKQIINVGIAEQNMIGFASGLAIQGKIVFVYSIANFPTLRPLEQIRNDAAYHNLNVKIVSVGAGLSYGSLGMSHHATEDIGVMASIPNINIFSPSNDYETVLATKFMYENTGVSYLRLGRQKNILNYKFNDISKVNKIISGNSIALIGHGEIINEVILAIKDLNQNNIHPSLYSVARIKPIDKKSIENILLNYNYVVSIEENNIVGGLASLISFIYTSSNKFKTKFLAIGIEDKFISDVGSRDYLLKVNNLDYVSISNRILHFLRIDHE